MDKRTRLNRIGEVSYNNYGSKMEIIEYIDANHIVVKFSNEYKVKASYKRFQDGEISNPYDKTVYGIGYLGEGDFVTGKGNLHTKMYETWRDMIRRSYDINTKAKYSTYKNVTCCKEWHNFQNFGKWFNENYYEIEGQKMDLDKDILHKGNKIYSPETCIFVPHNINSLFIKSNKTRGTLPIGVTKNGNKYMARCNCVDEFGNNIRKTVGRASTSEKAFELYKDFKESYIKQVADEYKDKIPMELYEAMYNWVVEIDD